MDFMYEGRHAGVLLHITSLPSKCGIVGDFGKSAEPFLDYLQAAGYSYWQVLPVGPCSYAESQPGCPYLSRSSFALNSLFVCPEGLVADGLVTDAQVQTLVAKWQRRQAAARQAQGEGEAAAALEDKAEGWAHVDYAAAKGYKDELLALAYATFSAQPPPEAFEEFCRRNKFWLEAYARFEAIHGRHPDAESWLEWPEEFRSYKTLAKDPALLEALEPSEALRQTHDAERLGPVENLSPKFHEFVQYVLAQQWAQLRRAAHSRGVKIMGDIAFYVNMHSSDVWSNTELFQMDPTTNEPLFVSGVPPDCFSAEGQLWGHPVYDWEAHAKSGYWWWTQRLAASVDKFDACRLDHFRGFESYWRVPYDFAQRFKSAREGNWEQGPGTKLFDAVFKNLGWENLRVNVATGYAEALSQMSRRPPWWRRLLRRLRGGRRRGDEGVAHPHQGGGPSSPHQPTLGEKVRQSVTGMLGAPSHPAPLLIAEDLGFITPAIVALRDRYGIFSMRVLQFAWADGEKGKACEHLPYNHTRDCVVYTGTHDNSTTRAWWQTATPEQKQHLMDYLGLKEEPSENEIHTVLSRLALLSGAHLVVLPAQDLLGLDDRSRFNLPGVDSKSNWSWKLTGLHALYSPNIFDTTRDLLLLSNRHAAAQGPTHGPKSGSLP